MAARASPTPGDIRASRNTDVRAGKYNLADMKTQDPAQGVLRARKHSFSFMLFSLKTRCFLESLCPQGLSWQGCAASEAPGWLGSHPSMAALVLQAMCRLGPQQDKQSLASALVPRPWRREAQGEEATCVTSGFHNSSVDGQHASPLLCQELCLLTEKTITGCSGIAVYGFLGTPYDRRR